MSPISSNSVFHFTSKIDTLISILGDCFCPHYCLETLESNKHKAKVALPMVCFCDIPLSQIKDHIKKYGNYGIGLSKEWAKNQGLNPVLYLEKSSVLSTVLWSLLDETAFHGKPSNQSLKLATDIFSYIKPYEGTIRKNDKLVKARFYDEREWRYVPESEDARAALSESEYNDAKMLTEENRKLQALSLDFQPTDIKYIIVKKEKEINILINKIRDIKGSRYHYPEDIIDKLTSRIITSKQIKDDF